MSMVLRRLGWAAPAALAALALAACGGNSASPTTASASAQAVATASADQEPGASITIQGTVVDAAGRPMANAEVECMGDVQCVRAFAQVIQQDGPDDGVKTNAQGAYTLVAKRAGASDRFLMNATSRGYHYMVREVAFPDLTCTSDRSGCTVQVNFTLTDQEQ